MISSHRRSDPQYFHLDELPFKEASGAAGKEGIESALISQGESDLDITTLTRIPSGSTFTVESGLTVEVLVLAGSLEFESGSYGVGSYICVPADSGPATIKANEAASVIVYQDPEQKHATARAVNPWTEDWRADIPGSHGLLHKSLRLPDVEADWTDESGEQVDGAPGGYVRLVFIAPGADPRQHAHHKCWEEILVLRGDMFIGERGHCRGGSYMANPVDFYHAPFASQGGALCVVHTDGPMDIPFDFRDTPEGERQVGEYLAGEPLFETPRHEPL